MYFTANCIKKFGHIMSLTSLTTAQQIVLDAAQVLGCEKVGLLDALGRVLGEDIIAPRCKSSLG